MLNILYANPYSLFDYTSGSSKSISLILRKFSSLDCNVSSIFSCASYSRAGYEKTTDMLKKFNQNSIVNNFIWENIKCTIIKTNHWDRRKLTLNEQRLFFQETIALLTKNKIDLIISWGNLKLEESIFKEARKLGIKICFYLVNPNYFGEQFYLKDNADFSITDSYSTKKLYENFIKNRIVVLPKCLEENLNRDKTKKNSKNFLIVNPSINKGIEPLLLLSRKLELSIPEVNIYCIDGRDQFYPDLKYLGYDKSDLPHNIKIFPPCNDINSIYRNVKIVLLLSLWHESGSRVIKESYSNGTPVICFKTGGNSELIGENKKDIFDMPDLYKDKNNRLRVKSWDNQKMFERILYLNKNESIYDKYSGEILDSNTFEENNVRINEELLKLISFIRDS